MSEDEQKILDKRYEDFMSEIKKKNSVLYFELRSKEIPIKESK